MKIWFIRGSFLAIMALVVYLQACRHKEDPVVTPVARVCFSEDVRPLFLTYCAQLACHAPSAASDGYILDTYSHIISKGIVPFKPDDSKIFQVLVTAEQDDRMPQYPQPALSRSQINIIRTWILQGATNDSCAVNCDTVDVTYSGQITTLMKKHCLGCHNGSASSSGIDLST